MPRVDVPIIIRRIPTVRVPPDSLVFLSTAQLKS